MPSSDFKQDNHPSAPVFQSLIDHHHNRVTSADILHELSSLSRKIDALAAQLQPARSAIITGPEVERVFKMLREQP